MTSYTAQTTYSNQFQYNPYGYSSYQTTPYGMTTDLSLQNNYYATDGRKITKGDVGRAAWGVFKFGVKLGLQVAGAPQLPFLGGGA